MSHYNKNEKYIYIYIKLTYRFWYITVRCLQTYFQLCTFMHNSFICNNSILAENLSERLAIIKPAKTWIQYAGDHQIMQYIFEGKTRCWHGIRWKRGNLKASKDVDCRVVTAVYNHVSHHCKGHGQGHAQRRN